MDNICRALTTLGIFLSSVANACLESTRHDPCDTMQRYLVPLPLLITLIKACDQTLSAMLWLYRAGAGSPQSLSTHSSPLHVPSCLVQVLLQLAMTARVTCHVSCVTCALNGSKRPEVQVVACHLLTTVTQALATLSACVQTAGSHDLIRGLTRLHLGMASALASIDLRGTQQRPTYPSARTSALYTASTLAWQVVNSGSAYLKGGVHPHPSEQEEPCPDLTQHLTALTKHLTAVNAAVLLVTAASTGGQEATCGSSEQASAAAGVDSMGQGRLHGSLDPAQLYHLTAGQVPEEVAAAVAAGWRDMAMYSPSIAPDWWVRDRVNRAALQSMLLALQTLTHTMLQLVLRAQGTAAERQWTAALVMYGTLPAMAMGEGATSSYITLDGITATEACTWQAATQPRASLFLPVLSAQMLRTVLSSAHGVETAAGSGSGSSAPGATSGRAETGSTTEAASKQAGQVPGHPFAHAHFQQQARRAALGHLSGAYSASSICLVQADPLRIDPLGAASGSGQQAAAAAPTSQQQRALSGWREVRQAVQAGHALPGSPLALWYQAGVWLPHVLAATQEGLGLVTTAPEHTARGSLDMPNMVLESTLGNLIAVPLVTVATLKFVLECMSGAGTKSWVATALPWLKEQLQQLLTNDPPAAAAAVAVGRGGA